MTDFYRGSISNEPIETRKRTLTAGQNTKLSGNLLQKDFRSLLGEGSAKPVQDTRAKSVTSMQQVKSLLADRKVPGPFDHVKEVIVPKVPNPASKAGFISRWLFLWVNPFFNDAQHKVLKNSDLYTIPDSNKAKVLEKKFQELQEKPEHCNKTDIEISKLVIRENYVKGVRYYLMANAIEFGLPLVVKAYTRGMDIPFMDDFRFLQPFVYLAALIGILVLRYLWLNQGYNFLSITRLAGTLRQRIFNKLLTISLAGADNYSEANLINMVTTDIDNISSGILILPDFLNALILFTIGMYYFLYFWEIAAILIILTVLALFGFRFIRTQTTKLRKAFLDVNDEKTKTIKKLLKEISVVKLAGTERLFYEEIIREHLVQNELIRSTLKWDQTASLITFYLPTLFAVVIFGCSLVLIQQQRISESSSYLVLTVLSIIKVPINSVSDGFRKLPRLRAAEARINEFLSQPNKVSVSSVVDFMLPAGTILFKDCSLSYSTDEKDVMAKARGDNFEESRVHSSSVLLLHNTADLRSLNLTIEANKHYVVHGEERSASSLMLLAAARELQVVKGKMSINGRTVYQNDKMYFVEDTVLQNIVLGTTYDDAKYWSSIRAVGLESFFRGENSIEKTVISENGKELPEDLKKLLILARLIYLGGDIVIIDGFFDLFPLRFRQAVLKTILANAFRSCTVLVGTGKEQVAQLCERAILIKRSTVEKVIDITQLDDEDKALFETTLEDDIANSNVDLHHLNTKSSELANYSDKISNVARERSQTQKHLMRNEEYKNNVAVLKQKYQEKASYFQTEIGERQTFKRTSIMTRYFLFNSGVVLPVVCMLLIMIALTGTYMFSWFVSSWRIGSLDFGEDEYFYIFIGLSLLVLLSACASAYIFTIFARRIAFKLFVYLLKGMLLKSWEWFQTRSHDILLSRFVAEFLQLDEILGHTFHILIQHMIKIHVVFIIVMYQTYYTMIPLIIIYYMIMRALRQVSAGIRAARGVMSANQSFLIHSTIEMHRGLIHFRNCSGVTYPKEGFMLASEVFQNSRSHQGNMADRWLCTRIHGYVMFLPVLVMLNEIIRVNILGKENDPNWGIKMTFSFDLVLTIQKLISSSISKESLSTVMEGLECLIVPDEWTDKRKVLSLGFQPLPSHAARSIKVVGLVVSNPVTTLPLLSGVTFSVEKGQKICIVGNRGSGKQTLVSAMLRLVDPTRILAGQILYDGRSLQSLPDNYLRKEVLYLPCKTVLAPGSLRDNLDPKKEFADEILIKALDYVGYIELAKEKINAGERGLSLQDKIPDKFRMSGQMLKSKINTIRDTHRISLDFERDAPSFEVPHSVFKLKEHTYVESLKQSPKKASVKKTSEKRSPEFRFDSMVPIIEETTMALNPDNDVGFVESSKTKKDKNSVEPNTNKLLEKLLPKDSADRNPPVDIPQLQDEDHLQNEVDQNLDNQREAENTNFGPVDDFGLQIEGCSVESLEDKEQDMVPDDKVGYYAQSVHLAGPSYLKHTAPILIHRDAPLLLSRVHIGEFSKFVGTSDHQKLGAQLLQMSVVSSSLSGLVALARVLVRKPHVLIVDAEWPVHERTIIRNNWANTTVIITGEDKSVCNQWKVDKCLILDKGVIRSE
jgi:ATP-binding cassette subfamily C (CFTR/MRP) protein 1